MNLLRRFVLAASLVTSAYAATQENTKLSILPSSSPLDRYQEMIRKSPFAPATPTVEPVAAVSFASEFYVSSLAKIGEKDVVTVRPTDPSKPSITLVSGEEESASGMTLLGVEWAEPVNNSRVNVGKGSEKGTLKFDQNIVTQKVAAAPPVQPPAQPGQPGQPRPVTQNMNAQRVPNLNVQPPGATGRVQTNVPQPAAGVPQPAQPNPAVPRPGETRRRIRIINSTP